MAEEGNWDCLQITFSVTFSSKSANTLQIFSQRTSPTKLTLYTVSMINAFDFVPDVYTITVKRGGFLGLFRKRVILFLTRPASVTTQDLENLGNFFDIVAYDRTVQFLEGFKAESPAGQ
jgi:hypothetical protein